MGRGPGLGLGMALNPAAVRKFRGGSPTPTPTPSLPVPGAISVYTAVGDSQVQNTAGAEQQWGTANAGTITFYNKGVGGNGIQSMINRMADIMSTNPDLVTLRSGANDLMQFATAAAYYAKQKELIDLVWTYRPNCCVVLESTFYLDEAAPDNSPPSKNGFNARCDELRALQRSRAGIDFHAYVPCGEDPNYSIARMVDDGPISTDGLHLNQSGANNSSGLTLAAVLNPIRDGATATAPSAYTYTDQTNCVPGSTQDASAIITGMKWGHSVSGVLSGDGTWAQNNSAYGTGNFTFMNGDRSFPRLTASMTALGVRNATTDIGGTSDTFSATTAPAASLDFNATAAEQFFAGGFSSGNTRTFSGVAHPGGVPYLGASTNGGRTFTSISITGYGTLSVIPSAANGDQFFIGTGGALAAGNYDIVVTLSDTIGDLYVWPGGITDLTSTTPVGVSKLSDVFRFDGVQNAGSVITLGSGGVIVALGKRSNGATISAYGPGSGSLVKDYGTNKRFWWKSPASGTPNFTTAGSSGGAGNTMITACGFG